MLAVSLWGKYGQRLNMKKTKFINEPSEYFDLLLDDTVDDKWFTNINEETIIGEYNMKKGYIKANKNGNIHIAAFTTCYARLKLWEVLNKLGDRVLGFDTDSVWYKYNDTDQPILEYGDSLGDMKNELKEGEWIKDNGWVGTGPKSYAYETNLGNLVVKSKGLTLNYKNSKKVTMKSMKKTVRDYMKYITLGKDPDYKHKTVTLVDNRKIVRDKKNNIKNVYQERIFRCCYNKRVMFEDKNGTISSYPYGYVT